MGHYDDVDEAGSLSEAIEAEGARLGLDWAGAVFEGRGYADATAMAGRRHVEVSCALEVRRFLFDGWERGHLLASGATASLEDLARAVHGWLAGGLGSKDLVSRNPFLKRAAIADAAEAGAGALVAQAWEGLAATPLGPYAALARAHPAVGRLRPFLSVHRLCLSRCTGYPYSKVGPIVVASRGGFEVWDGDVFAGWGDATEALRLVAARLAADCGPAVHGNSDDL
jgi:hypothetical protein